MKIGFDAKKIVKNKTGIGNYSRDLILSLARSFPRDEYFLYVPQKKTVSRDWAKDLPNIHFCASPTKRCYEYWRCFGIYKTLTKDNIDIFHGLSNEIPFSLNRTRCKKVVTIHDLIFLRKPETYTWLNRIILKWKTRYACRHADSIIAVSEQTKQDIIYYYHISPEKIQVVYQGCNERYYSPIQDETIQQVLAQYHLPKRFILNVGTIEQRKNQGFLIQLMPQLPADINLVIIGKPTKFMSTLQEEAKRLNVANRVYFLHNIFDVELQAIYHGASLFVYPSLYEGFGIPLLEALVSGLPIISSPDSCLQEVGGPGTIYCKTDDDSIWIKNIISVLENPQQQQIMRNQGLVFAKKFSKQFIASQIHSLYHTL